MKTIIFSLILLITCGFSIWQNNSEAESEYARMEQEKARQKQDFVRQLTEQEEACKRDRNQFRREKDDYDRRNRKLEMELSLLQEERQNFRAEIANLDKKIALMNREEHFKKDSKTTGENPSEIFRQDPKSTPEPKTTIMPNPQKSIKPPEPVKPPELAPFSVFPLSRKPLSEKKERLALFFEISPRQLLSEMEIELSPGTGTYNIEPHQAKTRIHNNRLILSSPPPGAYRLYFSAPIAEKQKVRWKFTSLQGHKGSHEIQL